MNNKRLISLTACLILATVPGISSLILADIASETDTKAQQQFEKANELRKLADYDAAITEYKKAISLSANSKIAQDAQYWIGQSYFGAGQFDVALSAFQKLLDEYPASTIVPSTKIMIERIQQAKENKPLFEAAGDGDIEQVKKLISQGADVNAGSDNWTPLHQAVNADSVEVAELLIAKGAVPKDTLYYAIWNKNEEMVRLLVSKGADVNAQQEKYGWTPLHHAVFGKNFDIIKFLVDNGAKFDVKSSYGFTALRYAVFYGDRDLFAFFISKGADDSSLHAAAFMGKLSRVKDLIEQGIDVNSKDELGWTALRWAAYADQIEVAEILIDNGADMKRDSDREPLLHMLVQKGRMEMAKLLIDKGADVNIKTSFGSTPLHQAANTDDTDVAELLIAKGADVNAVQSNNGWTPLYIAVGRGHEEMAKFLIANGADVNKRESLGNRTPLLVAAERGHQAIVELLLAHGADVNAGGLYKLNRTAAELAMKNNHNEIVKLLISKGADISPLHFALYVKDEAKAKSLIEDGADVNKRTPYGTTPLHRAADEGFKDIAELIISKGADVNAQDNWNWTPLHSAVYGHKDMVELLIAKGADVNARDGDSRTPLWYAEKHGQDEIVELLRKHGARGSSDIETKTFYEAATDGDVEEVRLLIREGVDVNARDWRNASALHYAARSGHKETIELLLAHGADVNAKTSEGKTPLSLAQELGRTEIVELLKKHGAKK